MPPTSSTRPARSTLVALGGAAAMLLAACSSSTVTGPSGASAGSAVRVGNPPTLAITPADGSNGVHIDSGVTVVADRGSLDTVAVHSTADPTALSGSTSADGRTWTLSASLDPGTGYVVEAKAHDSAGNSTSARSSFTTMNVVKKLTTSPTPSDGDVVGVGMPIILRFNTEVPSDKQAALIQHISVTAEPSVVGAWHWYGGSEVRYRPKDYWQPNSKVTVAANLKGVDAGGDVWGLGNWSETFTIGEKHLSIINAQTHQMQVFASDQLLHTYPVSTGREPRFPTISGTMFVQYKLQKVHMDSLSLGIPHNSPLGYNEDVFWDTAISSDGFFIHSAPWSVWAQGNTNVSHGCVNLSPERATEFFNFSRPGDVVQVTGTSRTADASDGEADWQIAFDQYANSGGQTTAPAPSGTSAGGL